MQLEFTQPSLAKIVHLKALAQQFSYTSKRLHLLYMAAQTLQLATLSKHASCANLFTRFAFTRRGFCQAKLLHYEAIRIYTQRNLQTAKFLHNKVPAPGPPMAR